jgi:hypothetical protein
LAISRRRQQAEQIHRHGLTQLAIVVTIGICVDRYPGGIRQSRFEFGIADARFVSFAAPSAD